MCGQEEQEEQEPGFSPRHRQAPWRNLEGHTQCWAEYLGPAVVTDGSQGLLTDANRFFIHI